MCMCVAGEEVLEVGVVVYEMVLVGCVSVCYGR